MKDMVQRSVPMQISKLPSRNVWVQCFVFMIFSLVLCYSSAFHQNSTTKII